MDNIKRILCYGDSNTFGTIPQWTNPKLLYTRYDENTRWTCILQGELGPSYKVIEAGLPGRTTIYDDTTEPFSHFAKGEKDIEGVMMMNAPLDMVIMMLGTNDLHTHTPPDENTIGVGIEKLIDIIQKSSYVGRDTIVPKILLLSPCHVIKPKGRLEVYDKFYRERGVKLSHMFAPVYKEIADKKGCFFLDAAEYAHPGEGDGIHFTQESHLKLGKALASYILDIYK